MTKKSVSGTVVAVESMIHTIRAQRVILDADLARIYGISTKILNKAVSRNIGRFPADFAFQLTSEEFLDLRFQNGTSRLHKNVSSHGGRRYRPRAFTEHGCLMAANILRSLQAVEMSVFVVRAFVRMRQMLSAPHDLSRKLAELEAKLTARLDGHETAITEVLQQIMLLLNPQPIPDQPHDPPAKQIGFHVRERSPKYESGRRVRKAI